MTTPRNRGPRRSVRPAPDSEREQVKREIEKMRAAIERILDLLPPAE